MAAASPFFRPARSANRHESRANEQKNRGFAPDPDSCITVAVPHVRGAWGLPPPTQDTLRVIASYYPAPPKRKRGWRRARDSANLRSRLRSSLCVGWAFCDAVRYSTLFRIPVCLTIKGLFLSFFSVFSRNFGIIKLFFFQYLPEISVSLKMCFSFFSVFSRNLGKTKHTVLVKIAHPKKAHSYRRAFFPVVSEVWK